MTVGGSLLLPGKKEIYFSDLMKEDGSQTGSSDFEGEILSFCRSWLRGEKSFSVQSSGSTGRAKKILLFLLPRPGNLQIGWLPEDCG